MTDTDVILTKMQNDVCENFLSALDKQPALLTVRLLTVSTIAVSCDVGAHSKGWVIHHIL